MIFIVIRVAEKIEDENFAGAVVYRGDEAEGVAGDVEDGDRAEAGDANFISVREIAARVHNAAPVGFPRDLQPAQQRRRGLRVLRGKPENARRLDDAHGQNGWCGDSWRDYRFA